MGQGKHKGSKNSKKEDRDLELYKMYRKITKQLLEKRGFVSMLEAVEVTRNSECSCFFVSYDRAYTVLLRLEKYNNWSYNPSCKCRPSNPLWGMKPTSRTMFLDLYHIYEQIRLENPDEARMESVIKACGTPAKQFYLTFDSARIIINKQTRLAEKKKLLCRKDILTD